MGKTVSVWGSPSCGKTVFTLKLAKSLYDSYESRVVCVFPDMGSPVLPVIFPGKKKNELYSLGCVMSMPEIDKDETVKHMNFPKKRGNFAVLGYAINENRYSYPEYSTEKAAMLLNCLNETADYVFIDCNAYLTDDISLHSVTVADCVLRLCTPDIKCMSFYASQLPLYADAKFGFERHICGLNVTDDGYPPIEEAKAYFGNIFFDVPFSRQVKEQYGSGELFSNTRDKRYEKVMTELAGKVVENA